MMSEKMTEEQLDAYLKTLESYSYVGYPRDAVYQVFAQECERLGFPDKASEYKAKKAQLPHSSEQKALHDFDPLGR